MSQQRTTHLSSNDEEDERYHVELPWFIKDILKDERVKEIMKDEYFPIYKNGLLILK